MPMPTQSQYETKIAEVVRDHLSRAVSEYNVRVLAERLVRDDEAERIRTAAVVDSWLRDIGYGHLAYADSGARNGIIRCLRQWRRDCRNGVVDPGAGQVFRHETLRVGDRVAIINHSTEWDGPATVVERGVDTVAVRTDRDGRVYSDQNGTFYNRNIGPLMEPRALAVGDTVRVTQDGSRAGAAIFHQFLTGDLCVIDAVPTTTTTNVLARRADGLDQYIPPSDFKRMPAVGDQVEIRNYSDSYNGPAVVETVDHEANIYIVRFAANHPIPSGSGGFSHEYIFDAGVQPAVPTFAIGDPVTIVNYSRLWNGPAVVTSGLTPDGYYNVETTDNHTGRANQTAGFYPHCLVAREPDAPFSTEYPIGTVIQATGWYDGSVSNIFQRVEDRLRGWSCLNAGDPDRRHLITDAEVASGYTVVEGDRRDLILNPPVAQNDYVMLTNAVTDHAMYTIGKVYGHYYPGTITVMVLVYGTSEYVNVPVTSLAKCDGPTRFPMGTVIRHETSGSIYTRVEPDRSGRIWRSETGGMFGDQQKYVLTDEIVAAQYRVIGVNGVVTEELVGA